MWDELTYPFSIFKDAIVEVWDLISNVIPHWTRHVMTYPCWDLRWSMSVVKGAPDVSSARAINMINSSNVGRAFIRSYKLVVTVRDTWQWQTSTRYIDGYQSIYIFPTSQSDLALHRAATWMGLSSNYHFEIHDLIKILRKFVSHIYVSCFTYILPFVVMDLHANWIPLSWYMESIKIHQCQCTLYCYSFAIFLVEFS